MMRLTIGMINAASPTPLQKDGTFDRDSARRLCRRWLDVGLDGVLLLGSMGEGLLLPPSVRTAFVETALEEVGDQVTLFVSTMDRSFTAMSERALQYSSMGVPYVMLSAAVGESSHQTVEHMLRLAETCPAPCAYYEVPAVTGVSLCVRELEQIMAHENIHALKDSSSNAFIAQALTSSEHRSGVKLLDGVEYRTAYSAGLGYDGVIHGGGVMTGRRVRCIWEKATSGHMREAFNLDRENSVFLGRIYNRFEGPVQNIAGQKYVLKLLGLFADESVLVDQPLDEASRQRIARVLEEDREWLC